MQLAHRVADALGTSYNRTSFLPERKKMMQAWSDYLDDLRTKTTALKHPHFFPRSTRATLWRADLPGSRWTAMNLVKAGLRKRTTLLVIISALANKARMDIETHPTTAAKELVLEAQLLGVTRNHQAIEGKVKTSLRGDQKA